MATPPPPQPPPPPPPPQWGAQFPQQPPGGPQLPVDRSQITPRTFWYWIAGAIAVLMLVFAILVIVSGGDDEGEEGGSLLGVFDTLEELEAPGEITVDLQASDEEWAIYELTSDSSEGFGTEPAPNTTVDCQVEGPSGGRVPLDSNLGFGTVTLNGDVYTTAYTFDVAESGAYRVACDPQGGASASLLVGQQVSFEEVFGFFGDLFGGIGRALLGGVILLLGLMIAGGIALGVWLSRSRKIAEARRGGALQ